MLLMVNLVLERRGQNRAFPERATVAVSPLPLAVRAPVTLRVHQPKLVNSVGLYHELKLTVVPCARVRFETAQIDIRTFRSPSRYLYPIVAVDPHAIDAGGQ